MVESASQVTESKPFFDSLDETTRGHIRTALLFTTKDGREYLTKLLYKIIIFSLCVMAPFIVICAVVQIDVLGTWTAITVFWPYWLATFGIPLVVFVVVYFAVGLFAVCPTILSSYLVWRFPRHLGWLPKAWKWLSEYFGLCIGIVILVLVCIVVSAKESVETRARLGLDPNANLPSITQVASQQNKALTDLSASGNAMLNDLNSTEKELELAKTKLSVTLAGLARQEKDAANATEELKSLSVKEQTLRNQLRTVSQVVDNQRIPTTQDLERTLEAASRKDQAWNFLWAIPAGILSILIWELAKAKLTSLNKKNTETTPAKESIED